MFFFIFSLALSDGAGGHPGSRAVSYRGKKKRLHHFHSRSFNRKPCRPNGAKRFMSGHLSNGEPGHPRLVKPSLNNQTKKLRRRNKRLCRKTRKLRTSV